MDITQLITINQMQNLNKYNMNHNQIIKPESQVVTSTQKQEMNTIVNKIIELIKEKHL